MPNQNFMPISSFHSRWSRNQARPPRPSTATARGPLVRMPRAVQRYIESQIPVLPSALLRRSGPGEEAVEGCGREQHGDDVGAADGALDEEGRRRGEDHGGRDSRVVPGQASGHAGDDSDQRERRQGGGQPLVELVEAEDRPRHRQNPVLEGGIGRERQGSDAGGDPVASRRHLAGDLGDLRLVDARQRGASQDGEQQRRVQQQEEPEKSGEAVPRSDGSVGRFYRMRPRFD